MIMWAIRASVSLVACFNFEHRRVKPFNLVLFASTTVCCAGRPATRYQAAREPRPRLPTAFQDSTCVRRELKRRKYEVRARYQVRANALLREGRLRGYTNSSRDSHTNNTNNVNVTHTHTHTHTHTYIHYRRCSTTESDQSIECGSRHLFQCRWSH